MAKDQPQYIDDLNNSSGIDDICLTNSDFTMFGLTAPIGDAVSQSGAVALGHETVFTSDKLYGDRASPGS